MVLANQVWGHHFCIFSEKEGKRYECGGWFTIKNPRGFQVSKDYAEDTQRQAQSRSRSSTGPNSPEWRHGLLLPSRASHLSSPALPSATIAQHNRRDAVRASWGQRLCPAQGPGERSPFRGDFKLKKTVLRRAKERDLRETAWNGCCCFSFVLSPLFPAPTRA